MLVPVGKYKSLQVDPTTDMKEVSFTAPAAPPSTAAPASTPVQPPTPQPTPSVQQAPEQPPIKTAVPLQESVKQPPRPVLQTPIAQPLPKGIRDLLSKASKKKRKPKRLNWLTL